MKNQIIKQMLILVVLSVIFASCNRSPRADTPDQVTSQMHDYSSYHQEMEEIIRNSIKPIEIIEFLNARGASYIHELTFPVEHAERFETTPERALAMGVYNIDMFYAYLYERNDIVVRNIAVSEELMVRTGLIEDFPDFARIKNHENNKDSLDILLDRSIKRLHEMIQNKPSPHQEAMIFVGGNIQAMYLLSQITMYARENQDMTDFLLTKGDYGRGILRLLEILSEDPSVRPYYDRMLPIVNYMEQHPEMNQDQVRELAGLIESIRNQMLM